MSKNKQVQLIGNELFRCSDVMYTKGGVLIRYTDIEVIKVLSIEGNVMKAVNPSKNKIEIQSDENGLFKNVFSKFADIPSEKVESFNNFLRIKELLADGK